MSKLLWFRRMWVNVVTNKKTLQEVNSVFIHMNPAPGRIFELLHSHLNSPQWNRLNPRQLKSSRISPSRLEFIYYSNIRLYQPNEFYLHSSTNQWNKIKLLRKNPQMCWWFIYGAQIKPVLIKVQYKGRWIDIMLKSVTIEMLIFFDNILVCDSVFLSFDWNFFQF